MKTEYIVLDRESWDDLRWNLVKLCFKNKHSSIPQNYEAITKLEGILMQTKKLTSENKDECDNIPR